MPQENKETLRRAFRTGEATQQDFINLIDSTVNKLDDGIDIDKENGLKLTMKGTSKQLMTFYENMQKDALWKISLQAGINNDGLNFTEGNKSRLFLKEGGKIGMGTVNPQYALDVKGLVGMEGRVGTYKKGYVSASGDWKSITEPMDGCHAFEIFAHINDENDGRFALTYAVALFSDGVSGTKKRVITTDASSKWLWGSYWNKIKFRWYRNDAKSAEHNKELYELQIKSRTHYGFKDGTDKRIFYRITRLWDKSYELKDYNPMYPVSQYPDIPKQATRVQHNTPVQASTPTKKPSKKIVIKGRK